MKNKKFLFIPLFMVVLVGVFVMAFSMGSDLNNNPTNSQMIGYNSMVCKEVTRADGTVEPKDCSHNILYTTGKEAIEVSLGTGSADAFDWIELCDSVAAGCGVPQADSSETYTAHGADGLEAVAGTVGSNAPSGNWSVWNTFTATADNQLTNVSHLTNDADVELAGNNFGLVNLSNGDSLLLNWTIWVT